MFADWDNFFLLIGSAAGALIGLLFVVVTLTTERDLSRAARATALFMTPTVFHFAAVLVLSALAMAPTAGATFTGAVVAAVALIGFAYATRVAASIGRGWSPELTHWSDRWYYGIVPALLYLALGGGAAAVWAAPAWAPQAIAAALLLLLLVGIRNAWDLVTWLAPRHSGNG